jgi:3-phenylpropionate/trans-cinnamate dioxygenase ferredoxin reductase component
MPDIQTHVIVGAGLAGAKAAEALRSEGFDGRIVLIGDESELPYERPPLSKAYLRGETPREEARVHPDDFYAANGIELRTSTAVERIDAVAGQVTLSTGDRLGYDRLLLATGAEPRRLSAQGSELEGVHYLRDLADADRIAARLSTGGRLAVIGGGWIGAEVAASARQMGLEVAIVERGRVPLQRVLGDELGEFYAQVHRDQGVRLVPGAELEGFEGTGRVERLRLADGRTLETDSVVVGVGVLPRTAVAQRAGIAVDNGILVDERLETSKPGVFAAGDVANAYHPFWGHRLRVEHWANALNQPACAAKAMLGKSASYERLPYFFSDQYDVGMEYSGYARSWDHVVFRGDPAKREFVAFWLEQGRVVAGMNVNVWDVSQPIQELVRSRRKIDARRLRDTEVELEDLVDTQSELETVP